MITSSPTLIFTSLELYSVPYTDWISSKITFNVATAGTDVQTGLMCEAKGYKIVTGLDNGAQTLTSLATSHGTSAQADEIVYNTLIT